LLIKPTKNVKKKLKYQLIKWVLGTMSNQIDTIAAIATPAGRGGIGVVRISGPLVPNIAGTLLTTKPKPRHATFSQFIDRQGELLDHGIALYFTAPHSFTGEHILELQGHGGPVVMDLLLNAVLELGARLARPGEFSERAFLNGKIDLAQAEAVADLIDSTSAQAARSALRSLQGQFSDQIHALVQQLTQLRSYIEASIDFVDEDIDVLADGQIIEQLDKLIKKLNAIIGQAEQGYLLKEGVRVALIGEPNVGKSSLLNRLAGRQTAIVTPIPGTTRDMVHEQIQLDGMPLHLIDTAGLRESDDLVEQEGIRRTEQVIKEADLVMVLLDDRHFDDSAKTVNDAFFSTELKKTLDDNVQTEPLMIRNKIDLTGHRAGLGADGILYLSAKTGDGVEVLKNCLLKKMGLKDISEGTFMARRRHIDALQRAKIALTTALEQANRRYNELLAEELSQAQRALGEITGKVTSDDLLGQIFSTFCIGK
jgi:tRNA modification GTPase